MVPTPNGAPHIAPPQPIGYSINDLYPSERSQIPFAPSVRDYFIQKFHMESREPGLEGLPQDQLYQAGVRAWDSLPITRVEEWEDSYREQLAQWREAMHEFSRDSGTAPIGVIRNRQQEGDRQVYVRGGAYDEGHPEDGAADAEDSAAASGGFTAVNG